MVMDEKELVKKIKNSFKAKKSRAEVTKNLQKKGYKLAYIDTMIEKAKHPQKILTVSLISILFLVMLSLSLTVYANRDYSHYENPLKNYNVISAGDVVKDVPSENPTNEALEEINKKEVIISDEFINFILSSIGVESLHKNPLTFEKPIINILVGEQEFSSVVDSEIITDDGLRTDADIQIETTSEAIVEALSSDLTEEVIMNSFNDGESSVELLASEAELFAKGYLVLYQKFSS